MKKISDFCSLLYTARFKKGNGIIAMTKKTMTVDTVDTSLFDFALFNLFRKVKEYSVQALCYSLLIFASFFLFWQFFFKEPSIDLYLQTKKEHALFQKSVQQNHLPSIDTLSKSLPSLLQKDSSLLQRYGFSTLQLLLIAEKQEEAAALYKVLSSSVPSPYLLETLAFRNAQWQFQSGRSDELLKEFISFKQPSKTAISLAQMQIELLELKNSDKANTSFIQDLAPYFSEGAVTLQQFLDEQAHLSE